MIKVNIPIFITVNTDTEELKNKNVLLLPYAYDYLSRQETINRCVVISKDDDVLEYAKKLGFKNTYKERPINCKACNIDYNGIYHHMQDNPTDYDWFIKFRLDQPFKSENLIIDAIRGIDYNKDFLVSASSFTDRERLYINEDDKFTQLIENSNRCMEKCVRTRLVDGSIWCFNTEFFKKCVESNDFYGTLWNGRYKILRNDSMFIQIMSADQVRRFYLASDVYNRIINMPKFGE